MKRTLKRILSLVMAFSMVMSLLTVTAFADGERKVLQPAAVADQIVENGGTRFYNEAGELIGSTVDGDEITGETNITEIDGVNGAVVSLSKTIAPGNAENEFDITLVVESILAKEKTETYAVEKDAAVVVTVDISGSMMQSGNTMTMDNETVSYMEAARRTGKDFIHQFAASAVKDTNGAVIQETSTAKRMVAIAGFDTDARTIMTWKDLNIYNPNNAELYVIDEDLTDDVAPAGSYAAIYNAGKGGENWDPEKNLLDNLDTKILNTYFTTYAATINNGKKITSDKCSTIGSNNKILDSIPCDCKADGLYYGNKNCTNFDGGVILTKNLLGMSVVAGSDESPMARFAVILSDGAPTVTVDSLSAINSTDMIDSPFTRREQVQSSSVTQGKNSGGGWTHPHEVENALTYLGDLTTKTTSYKAGVNATKEGIFMVGVGAAMDFKLFYHAIWTASSTTDVKEKENAFSGITPSIGSVPEKIENSADKAKAASMSTGDWLAALAEYSTIGGTYASAAEASELASAFSTIMSAIAGATKSDTYTSNAWEVSDPINATNPDRLKFVTLAEDAIGAVYGDDDTIIWELTEVVPVETNLGTEEAPIIKSTYTLKYSVHLLTESDRFVDGNDYDTNGTTTFAWQVTKNGQPLPDITAEFPVPQVEGYLGEFAFRKVDPSGKPIEGAVFTLTSNSLAPNSGSWSKEKASDADGYVVFEYIPSGHVFTLTEKSAPDNYDGGYKNNNVEVKFGEVTVDGASTATKTELEAALAAAELSEEELQELYPDGNIPALPDFSTVENSISISVKKVWDDNNNQDGIRPEAITINLMDGEEVVKTLTLNEGNKWQGTFSGLAKYKAVSEDGAISYVEIAYTVKEVPVNGYTAAEPQMNNDGVYVFTNSHTPAKTSISVEKKWNDNNNQDGKRPESVTVYLWANDEYTEKSAVLNEANNWKHTWTDLDKYADGNEIYYAVAEGDVDSYDDEVTGDAANGFVVTNTYVPAVTSVSVEKVWDDNNNQDGKRPASIQVQLYKQLPGGETAIAVGDPVAITAAGEWKYTFENLPKYDNAVEIIYTVDEVSAPAGYTKTGPVKNNDGVWTITNTHAPEKTSVKVEKVWSDNNNQDGKRPGSVTFNLFADGEKVADVVLSARNEWKHEFTNLDKYSAGEEIEYTVTENVVDGYTGSEPVLVNGVWTITNSYTPDVTSITVTKVWNDANDQDGKRPASIQVQLYANGVPSGDPVTLSGNWTYAWTGLAKYENGQLIEYTVDEVSVPDGYTKSEPVKNGNNFTITNSYTPEKTEVSVLKVWGSGTAGKEQEVTINLLANGNVIKSVKLNARNQWTYTWTNLDKYADGQVIRYTVTEDALGENWSRDIELVDGVWNVTNTYTPPAPPTPPTPPRPSSTGLTVKKVWVGDAGLDIRPESITVELLKDGVPTDQTKTLSAASGWQNSWTGLSLGSTWSAREINVPDGYTVSVSKSGTVVTITNTYETEDLPDDDPPLGGLEELPDEEPPLADAPKTGDVSLLWLAATAISGMGLIGLNIPKRKGRREED